MKTVTIIGADKVHSQESALRPGKDVVIEGEESMSVFDGYHTFDELYEHRIVLFIALCRSIHGVKRYEDGEVNLVWRAKMHSDGSSYDGWFTLGINREKGKQITYHLPLRYWEATDFAITYDKKEKVPEFDGHTPDDVLNRLKIWYT